MKDKKSRKSNWLPPIGSGSFFNSSSDKWFKEKHPIGYGFLVFLGILAIVLPMASFIALSEIFIGVNSAWLMLGVAGGFVFGAGLFNFAAIIIKQYLGHLVSIAAFLLGGVMMFVSWMMLKSLS